MTSQATAKHRLDYGLTKLKASFLLSDYAMSKRKREDDDGDRDGHTRRQNRLRAKFETSVNELTSALKLARGFERQKLGRRQKQASSEPQVLLRLREEVIVLKQLDLETTARNYLLKTLTKIKRIRVSQIFTNVFGACLNHEAGKSGSEANVLGRLFKSTPVKDAVSKAVTLMFKVLELQQGPASSSYHSPGEGNVAGGIPDPDDHSEDVEHVNADQTSPPLQEVDNFASFSSESSNMSGSPSIGPTDVEPKSVVDFLPSLGMTGYYSGSDSETTDDGPTGSRPRKNRRGQRARQQIAELKYGKKAKHLQNQVGDKGRHADWDARRGAVDRSQGRRYDIKSGRRSAGPVADEKLKPKTRDDSGPLHPSWQAAKQRKQQHAGQASFAGKRITFD
ncbi:hypothetical protein DV736_g6050, partial [Chaetothyriales sp. CBS 134916]